MTDALPPPIICHVPESHIMRRGNISGKKPSVLLEFLQTFKAQLHRREPTDYGHPSATKKISNHGKHQDLLASNVIS